MILGKCPIRYPGVFTNVAYYLNWIKETMTTIETTTTTPPPPTGNNPSNHLQVVPWYYCVDESKITLFLWSNCDQGLGNRAIHFRHHGSAGQY